MRNEGVCLCMLAYALCCNCKYQPSKSPCTGHAMVLAKGLQLTFVGPARQGHCMGMHEGYETVD